MPRTNAQKPDWSQIDTVLLDLDGTLLDLDFDNRFWREHIPERYAALHSLTPEEARARLIPRFRAREGTLDWYCVKYWSRELGLDVVALKEGQAHAVAWLPGAQEFLSRMRARGKRLVLVTNAHPEALRIKDERTGVKGHFDAVFSSHEFGAPKEDARFWRGLQAKEAFDPARTMFVDDSASVLRAARAAGISWVYAVCNPGTRDPSIGEGFREIGSVAQL